MTNEFKDAVESKKILRVRIMLKDSLVVDPTMTQYSEMEKYACNKLLDLYVEHDGEVLNYDENMWNEEYLNQQMVVVVNNFSKERMELLKKMVQYLYKEKAERIQRDRRESQEVHITRKQIGAGITIAGAVAATAGICASQTALIAGGIGIAVVGVVIIVSDRGK